MAWAKDALTQQSGGTTTISSLELEHTCSGSNRLLVAYVHYRETAFEVESVTFDATALTKVGRQVYNNTAGAVEMWYLIAPSTGKKVLKATLPGLTRIALCADSYTGIEQVSALRGFTGLAVPGESNPSKEISTAASDLVVDSFGCQNVSMLAVPNESQELGGNNFTGGSTGSGTVSAWSSRKAASGATTTMAWTTTANPTKRPGGQILAAFRAASEATGPRKGSLNLLGVGR